MINKQADEHRGEGKTQLSKQVAYRGGLAAAHRVLLSQGTKVQRNDLRLRQTETQGRFISPG